jgi:hypothetical protein
MASINASSKEQTWMQQHSFKNNQNINIFDGRTKYKYLKSPKPQNFSVDTNLLDIFKPDATRIQEKNITQDGIRIPVVYEPVARPQPKQLHEPVSFRDFAQSPAKLKHVPKNKKSRPNTLEIDNEFDEFRGIPKNNRKFFQ